MGFHERVDQGRKQLQERNSCYAFTTIVVKYMSRSEKQSAILDTLKLENFHRLQEERRDSSVLLFRLYWSLPL